MLSRQVSDLLSIDYKGLFDDHSDCMLLLATKRDTGDADTPPELTKGPIFDLSPDLFIWVCQQHIENKTAHLVANDIMSNIAAAGLSGSYGQMVDMLAEAGYHERAAQIWRADVASHVDVFREFLRARKTVERYDNLPEAKRKKPPDRFLRAMAEDFPKKQQAALEAIEAFERWSERYGTRQRHMDQIAVWKQEVRSQEKPTLPAADKTLMSEDLVWQIIAQAKASSESETILNIEEKLVKYTAKAIRDAAKIVQSRLVDAYQEEVWALAYLLRDGCSDDAFDDFRCWMVLQGKDTCDQIINAPDEVDPHDFDRADFGAAGSLMSAFENAYIARSGKPLSLPRVKRSALTPDEMRFAELLPTLSART
ncbi:MAG: DUF4240 domain-containing protein [Pseudomonadota bacterium]